GFVVRPTLTIRSGNSTWKNGCTGSWKEPLRVEVGSSTYGGGRKGAVRVVARRCDPARNLGTFIIGVGAVMEARTRWTIWSCCTSIVTGRFTMASNTDGLGRVLRKADRNARPYDARVSRAVPRGRGGRKTSPLPGQQSGHAIDGSGRSSVKPA